MKSTDTHAVTIPQAVIQQKLLLIRNKTVLLDRELALFYGVETRHLKRQVRRNPERFPEDFMFQLSKKEFEDWRRQFGTSNPGEKMGLRYAPYAFTEHGILMLSSVLNSPRAIRINIEIIRVFTKIRQMVLERRDLARRMEKLEFQVKKQEDKIYSIFDLISQMHTQNKKSAGFNPSEN